MDWKETGQLPLPCFLLSGLDKYHNIGNNINVCL